MAPVGPRYPAIPFESPGARAASRLTATDTGRRKGSRPDISPAAPIGAGPPRLAAGAAPT